MKYFVLLLGSPEAQTFSFILQDENISVVFRTDLKNVVLFERTSS